MSTPPKVRCRARSARTARPCRAWAIVGSTVCWSHGGAASQVRLKAARRRAEQEALAQAERLLAESSAEPVDDPFAELNRLTAEVVEVKTVFRRQLAALAEKDVTPERFVAAVELYERALDRALRALSTLTAGGFEERRLRIRGKMADQLIWVVDGILDSLALDAEQEAMRREVMAWWFNAAGGAEDAVVGSPPFLARQPRAQLPRAKLPPARPGAETTSGGDRGLRPAESTATADPGVEPEVVDAEILVEEEDAARATAARQATPLPHSESAPSRFRLVDGGTGRGPAGYNESLVPPHLRGRWR